MVSGERMDGWRWAVFATVRVRACLEGAVADGRAHGEGGVVAEWEGRRALQCTTRLCAARG